MTFTLRKLRPYTSSSIVENDSRIEITEMERDQKHKVVAVTEEVQVFFGVYCSQSVHLRNYTEIKVTIE